MENEKLLLTPRERAALERTGAIIIGAPTVDDALYDELSLAEQYDLDDAESPNPFIRSSKRVRNAPTLWRLNGFGVGLYGWLSDPDIPQGMIKLYFFSALWIPILPLCAFSVDRAGDGFLFYRKIGLIGLAKTFRWRVFGLYATAIFEGAAWMVLFVGLILAVFGALHWLRDRL
ncbi:hypothetical protein [Sphingopyxis sp.]|uniref:hypothetical protein n=1 Tax=Sphingopyxis sp. TaxID=1908224 RepID=UPI003D6CD5E3